MMTRLISMMMCTNIGYKGDDDGDDDDDEDQPRL